VMQPPLTGYVIHDVDSAAKAVEKVVALDRKKCREVFEARFTAERMAEDYVAVYRRLVEKGAPVSLSAGAWS
jgi:glycosyltransferase involved in cell wall biosynthesis